jgi:hypothetical protein
MRIDVILQGKTIDEFISDMDEHYSNHIGTGESLSRLLRRVEDMRDDAFKDLYDLGLYVSQLLTSPDISDEVLQRSISLHEQVYKEYKMIEELLNGLDDLYVKHFTLNAPIFF